MNAIAEPIKFAQPELKEGETYAGAIITPDGTGHHIIVLPGDQDDTDWQTQMDWAKSIGGDLPDRSEAALMFKHSKSAFKKTWYWTNEQHASDSKYAWCQGFGNGLQDDYYTDYRLRARAVRRVAI